MNFPLVGYRKNTEKMVCDKRQIMARFCMLPSKSTRDGEVEVELLFRDGYTKNASGKSLNTWIDSGWSLHITKA